MSLNEKQRRFVEAYLIDPNATKAAIAAGYSARTAAEQGSRLLRHPVVAAELARRRTQVAEATGITAAAVITELARVGFAKITDLVSWRSNVREMGEVDDKDGEAPELILTITNQVEFVDSDKLAPAVAAAIAEVSRSANGTIKIKMHDKLGALTKLGLHLGVFGRVDKPEAPGKKQAVQAKADGINRGKFAPPEAPKLLN
jgi:phage terminase small subunit